MTEHAASSRSTGTSFAERDDVDAIVYDLDGTLVNLVVDWDAVAREVLAVLADAGVDAAGVDLWGLLDVATEHGVRDEVEAVVSEREREGARQSERLPAADVLAEADDPVAVCSLNCEEACRIALEKHGLTEFVDAVVGRDSVGTRKPDPEPLLEAVRRLEVEPGRTLFVGDSERDEITAERAGVQFEYV